ncbi:hypothetical protein L2W15_07435 [Campylobacter coli]|nr:hypothetical protein [Campylobacter coli]MCE7184549.1 hypothetical protein [Campylobacter coli]MCE7230856.1 hypothetical protein [Campylobacter coli]MCE7232602.1 hypothetical protein [Campylobacter coli]MCE7243121.1 hypothetical protein [Campylobacter coli]
MKIKSQGTFLNASFSLPIPNITAKTIPRNETKTGLKMEVTFLVFHHEDLKQEKKDGIIITAKTKHTIKIVFHCAALSLFGFVICEVIFTL